MSNSIGESLDLMNLYQTTSTAATSTQSTRRGEDTPSNELSFTDMLQLMVLQFQNQTMDSTADSNDMMNQLVQMSVVQAMTSMSTQMEQLAQANVMSYSASLVGKEVTVGVKGNNGQLKEIVGMVTATGTYDGNPVIFLGNQSYALNSIMAVGRLPENATEGLDNVEDSNPDNSGDSDMGGMEAAGDNDAAAGPDWNGQPTVG